MIYEGDLVLTKISQVVTATSTFTGTLQSWCLQRQRNRLENQMPSRNQFPSLLNGTYLWLVKQMLQKLVLKLLLKLHFQLLIPPLALRTSSHLWLPDGLDLSKNLAVSGDFGR
jgi:hypothetical protein